MILEFKMRIECTKATDKKVAQHAIRRYYFPHLLYDPQNINFALKVCCGEDIGDIITLSAKEIK